MALKPDEILSTFAPVKKNILYVIAQWAQYGRK